MWHEIKARNKDVASVSVSNVHILFRFVGIPVEIRNLQNLPWKWIELYGNVITYLGSELALVKMKLELNFSLTFILLFQRKRAPLFVLKPWNQPGLFRIMTTLMKCYYVDINLNMQYLMLKYLHLMELSIREYLVSL